MSGPIGAVGSRIRLKLAEHIQKEDDRPPGVVRVSTDPFRALRQEYLERARIRIVHIRTLAQVPAPGPEALNELRILVHNLRGSGGFYGFAEISSAAAAIETLVLDAQEGERWSAQPLAHALQALTQAIEEAHLPE